MKSIGVLWNINCQLGFARCQRSALLQSNRLSIAELERYSRRSSHMSQLFRLRPYLPDNCRRRTRAVRHSQLSQNNAYFLDLDRPYRWYRSIRSWTFQSIRKAAVQKSEAWRFWQSRLAADVFVMAIAGRMSFLQAASTGTHRGNNAPAAFRRGLRLAREFSRVRNDAANSR